MSANRHLDPGVDTTLLKTQFEVATDAVGALRLPVKSNKFLLTVNLVRSFSSFSGFTLNTIFPYITFFFTDLIFENENECISPLYPLDTLS